MMNDASSENVRNLDLNQITFSECLVVFSRHRELCSPHDVGEPVLDRVIVAATVCATGKDDGSHALARERKGKLFNGSTDQRDTDHYMWNCEDEERSHPETGATRSLVDATIRTSDRRVRG